MWPYVHFEKTLETEKDEIVCLFFCTDSIRIRFSSKDIPRSHFALVHSSVCVFQLQLKVLKQACEWLWLILLRISRRCSTKCNNRVFSFSLKQSQKTNYQLSCLVNWSLWGLNPRPISYFIDPLTPENAGSNPTETFFGVLQFSHGLQFSYIWVKLCPNDTLQNGACCCEKWLEGTSCGVEELSS